MSIINILSPHVADMIAAGEVVERPSSVIKELIENSFDAGAGNITVEIRDGGMSYIRVTDDGCGMSPEDAGIAFIRHATSKLHDENGLEAISTMGFRGEALAAISSVSTMEIMTRERGSDSGIRLTLNAGEIEEMIPFGCPEGTTVTVRDLFFNTPARLKFMKSDRAEASACIAAAMKCALGRPGISVRFIRDGKEEFFSPGDGKLESCVYSLLGRDEASGMLSCSSSSDDLRLSGYISSPNEGRGNRSRQYFFINGRCIKSQLLQSALEQAYRDTLLTGRYPSCVLYLEMPFNLVDVNVHPAKTEVRFSYEKQIFDFVLASCKMALESEDRLAPRSTEAPVHGTAFTDSDPAPGPALKTADIFPAFMQNETFEQTTLVSYGQNIQSVEKVTECAPSQIHVDNFVENSVQNVENSNVPNHNILGQAFKTYIIVEHNGEILLIDKHAAHERMVFDRLCETISEIPSQALLSQTTLRLSAGDAEVLENNGELLLELGFEIEPFGENTFIVRAVPADLSIHEVSSAIEEIIEKLKSGKIVDPQEKKREIFHTVACKAAIKAGWDTDMLELQKIADAVISGRIKYCPHGRPVSVTVTRQDLDKMFKRIV